MAEFFAALLTEDQGRWATRRRSPLLATFLRRALLVTLSRCWLHALLTLMGV